MKAKYAVFSLIFALGFTTLSYEKSADWNGYIQTRLKIDKNRQREFIVRRAKLWINGNPPFSEEWSFKIQGVFLAPRQGAFTLQDAYIEKKSAYFSLRMGQMTPFFSLQRAQPDYLLSVLERARAIDALIPAGDWMGRDIGVMIGDFYHQHLIRTILGVFNGKGANRWFSDNQGYLLTDRTVISLLNKRGYCASLGFSLAYRRTENLPLKHIFGPDHAFSGKDFRQGLEGRIEIPRWVIQGEFLNANVGDKRSFGYYFITEFHTSDKNLIFLMIDFYRDLNPATDDNNLIAGGLVHSFQGDKARIVLENRIVINNKHLDPGFDIQLQMFLN